MPRSTFVTALGWVDRPVRAVAHGPDELFGQVLERDDADSGAPVVHHGAEVAAGPPELAQRLTAEFGKGFSAQSLWSYRQFYLSFPILSTAWRELSWSHFRMLLRLKSPEARAWYADEAAREAWGVRAHS